MRKYSSLLLIPSLILCLGSTGCPPNQGASLSQADTGVNRAHAGQLKTNSSGLTIEQQNIKDRLTMDNTPGSIKHLYIISSWSGQTLIYSTVRGKITSSGKRLTPRTVSANGGQYVSREFGGMRTNVGGQGYRTVEVIQDDGTYGSSIPYIYWWDAKGIYHQHYVSGGQILHVSDQPVRAGEVTINMEVTDIDMPAETPAGE